jgi:uncharacterized protein YdbL (DUF1318 family)
MNTLLRIAALSAAILCSVVGPSAHAQDPAIKQRIEKRLPAIDDLRQRQVAGENNAGFLEVRGKATPDEQQLVKDENADRTAVYDAIAARSETTRDVVGRTRARTIAATCAPGVLLQDAQGNWAPKR